MYAASPKDHMCEPPWRLFERLDIDSEAFGIGVKQCRRVAETPWRATRASTILCIPRNYVTTKRRTLNIPQ